MNLKRQNRLLSDFEELKSAFANDKYVDIIAIGRTPIEKYRIVFKVPALHLDSSGNPISVEKTVIEIQMPKDYPKISPVAKTIAGDVVFHPNFNSQKICLMDNWYPTAQISDLVREIGDMLQWRKFNIRAPLNAIAAEWSQKNRKKIPLSNHLLGTL